MAAEECRESRDAAAARAEQQHCRQAAQCARRRRRRATGGRREPFGAVGGPGKRAARPSGAGPPARRAHVARVEAIVRGGHRIGPRLEQLVYADVVPARDHGTREGRRLREQPWRARCARYAGGVRVSAAQVVGGAEEQPDRLTRREGRDGHASDGVDTLRRLAPMEPAVELARLGEHEHVARARGDRQEARLAEAAVPRADRRRRGRRQRRRARARRAVVPVEERARAAAPRRAAAQQREAERVARRHGGRSCVRGGLTRGVKPHARQRKVCARPAQRHGDGGGARHGRAARGGQARAEHAAVARAEQPVRVSGGDGDGAHPGGQRGARRRVVDPDADRRHACTRARGAAPAGPEEAPAEDLAVGAHGEAGVRRRHDLDHARRRERAAKEHQRAEPRQVRRLARRIHGERRAAQPGLVAGGGAVDLAARREEEGCLPPHGDVDQGVVRPLLPFLPLARLAAVPVPEPERLAVDAHEREAREDAQQRLAPRAHRRPQAAPRRHRHHRRRIDALRVLHLRRLRRGARRALRRALPEEVYPPGEEPVALAAQLVLHIYSTRYFAQCCTGLQAAWCGYRLGMRPPAAAAA